MNSRRRFCRNALFAGLAPATLGMARSGWSQARDESVFDPDARQTVLTLLHTNDPHGRVYLPDHAVGLTRLGTLVRRVREQMPHVLLLDAGDLIHGTPEEKAFEGKPIISAMNALRYDAATAGNHEFDWGQRVLKQAMDLMQFPLLSANVLDKTTGRSWGALKPYIVREVDGVRVAIFGLTTLDTIKFEFPTTLAGLEFADPIATARALVPRLRADEKADVVIFLSHLGFGPDKELAAAVLGIDVILGGHSHTRLEEQVWVNDTLIQQTGAHGKALGRVDLLIERGKGAQKARVIVNGRDGKWWGREGIAAPRGASYPAGPLENPALETAHDVAMLAAYQPYREIMTRRRAEVLTSALAPLPATDATIKATPLGTLLASAVRTQSRVDVGLFPSSALARGLPAGAINAGHAMDTVGGHTRQHIVTARVSGAALRKFAERALSSGHYPAQTSGIIRRPDAIEINGRKLRDSDFYTVAGAAFLMQDQFLEQPGVTITQDDPEALTTRQALIAYLRCHKPLSAESLSGQISSSDRLTPLSLR